MRLWWNLYVNNFLFFIIYFIHNFIIYFYLNFPLPIPLNLYLWWRHPRQFSVLFLFYLFLHPILRFYQKNKEKKKKTTKNTRGLVGGRMCEWLLPISVVCINLLLLHKKKKIMVYKMSGGVFSLRCVYIENENMEKTTGISNKIYIFIDNQNIRFQFSVYFLKIGWHSNRFMNGILIIVIRFDFFFHFYFYCWQKLYNHFANDMYGMEYINVEIYRLRLMNVWFGNI